VFSGQGVLHPGNHPTGPQLGALESSALHGWWGPQVPLPCLFFSLVLQGRAAKLLHQPAVWFHLTAQAVCWKPLEWLPSTLR